MTVAGVEQVFVTRMGYTPNWIRVFIPAERAMEVYDALIEEGGGRSACDPSGRHDHDDPRRGRHDHG